MSAPNPFNERGPALVSLVELQEKFPVSEVFPFRINGEMHPIRFRVLTSATKKAIKRDAELWVSRDYDERAEIEHVPGSVSKWIDTSGGLEAVVDEWRLRIVVASCVHEYEPGKYAPVFDGRQAARDSLTDEDIDVLDAEAMAFQQSYDTETWTVEMFADMVEDIKKKGSVSLTGFGTVNLAASFSYTVNRLGNSVITELLRQGSSSLSPIETTIEGSSTRLLQLQEENESLRAELAELKSQLGV
jgi:hypothetical protein